MAKKDLNFGKLGLPPKATIIKKEEAREATIEKAVEIIHSELPKEKDRVGEEPVVALVPEKVEILKEEVEKVIKPKQIQSKKAVLVESLDMLPVKKISMDLPLDVYKYLKMNAFNQAITMKDYVLRLIEADMKKKSK